MKAKYERLGCGLDIGKSKFHACFGAINTQAHFTVKASRSFANTPIGIATFLAWVDKQLTKCNTNGALPFQLLLETTGVYHEQVCLKAFEANLPVCVEVANRVKKYLQVIGQSTKTDKQDARGICQMACERKMKLWQPASPKLLAIRNCLRHRKSLIDNKVRLSNQLHALEYSAYAQPTVQASIQQVVTTLSTQIEQMEKAIVDLYESDQVLVGRVQPIVDSVAGLGLITVLTIVAETNGFSEIRSLKQLASYAGYDIVEHQSGTINRPSRISKKGNARIRQVMYMAALSLINTKSGSIYDFYLRIRSTNPKVYKIANVAVQRKLLLLTYTLYKNETAYDESYHLKTKKKNSSEQQPELCEIVPA